MSTVRATCTRPGASAQARGRPPWLTVPACPDRLRRSASPSRRCRPRRARRPRRGGGRGAVAAAEGDVVEVRRSARRRRTVTAYREQGRTVVLIPAAFSPAEERRWVAQMVAKLQTREERRRRSLGGDERPDGAGPGAVGRAPRRRWPSRPASAGWTTRTAAGAPARRPTARIRLSSRLRSMPEYVVDYVLVHELVHLLEPGHDERFWALVARYPRAERARGFLEGVEQATATPGAPAATPAADPSTRQDPPSRPSPLAAVVVAPVVVLGRRGVVGGQRGELVVDALPGDEVQRLVEVVGGRQQVRVRPEPVAVGAAVAAGPSRPTRCAASRSRRGRSSRPTRVAKVCSAGPPEARRRRIVSASAECPGSRSLAASATTVSTQPSTSASSVSSRRSAICCSGVSSGSSTPLPSSCWMLSGLLGSMPPSMPRHRLGRGRARWPRGRS